MQRQYLYIEHLAACTPWSEDAIRTKMKRGEFRIGLHYFKPGGLGGRPIFRWGAVADYIEGRDAELQPLSGIPLANGTVVDV